MDFNKMLTKLNELQAADAVGEGSAVLNKQYGSHQFGDQVSGEESAKMIPGGVLDNPGDAKHPFQGRLVGADESQDMTTKQLTEIGLEDNLKMQGFVQSVVRRAATLGLQVSNLKAFGRKNFTRLVDAVESLLKQQGYHIVNNEGSAISFENASGEFVKIIRPYGKQDMQVYKWDATMKPHENPKASDVMFQSGQLVLPEGQDLSAQTIEEDILAQLANEFADFLRDKAPLVDDILPAAEDRDISKSSADRELIDIKEQQPPVAQTNTKVSPSAATEQPKLSPIASQLSKVLGLNPNQLVAAYKAPKPSTAQLAILAQAFKKLASADPQTTAQAMALLKKISAEEPEQSAKTGTVANAVKKVAGAVGQAVGKTAGALAENKAK